MLVWQNRRRRRRRGVLKAREEWQRRLNMITAAAGMDHSARDKQGQQEMGRHFTMLVEKI